MTRLKLLPLLVLSSLAAFALIQIGGCANIVPPSGGPRDSIPPYAVYAKPKDSSVQIAPKEILISFKCIELNCILVFTSNDGGVIKSKAFCRIIVAFAVVIWENKNFEVLFW